LSLNPFMWLYLPVIRHARLGPHSALVTNALSNRIPSFASRSMFGVWLIFDPYAEIACDAWSSDMMYKMFGRCAACCGAWAKAPAPNTSAARTTSADGILGMELLRCELK